MIPKRPVENVFGLTAADRDLAGALLLACAEVARRLGLEPTGARIVLNAGTDGGQTVPQSARARHGRSRDDLASGLRSS